ncbi:hypothetical protein [Cytobacillus dafuensis]|uniref:Adhesin n=1 Tax=Cytobacillus dafuensis TaxID=1742359 RepID=A0A5B8Z8P7_CYTDA|nr:hypothetical protein [Cytobacillus dafuensis]QED49485.1 adhesin [Cytobacillus dafuensis]
MKITDGAKQLLENILSQNDAEGIRLNSVAGCCGPQFTISLEQPQQSDKIEMVNGIKVAVDEQITATEELILDKEETQEGAGLVLIGAGNCC